jgi:GNAT superfamily N-acetyltransferase
VEQEFSLLLSLANAKNTLFLSEERESTAAPKVLAAASYRPFDFMMGRKGAPPLAHRSAGIGLVVTDPGEQRRGYGYRLQQEIERRAQDDGALVTVLWSDLVQFYTKLGYLVAGTELQWQLDKQELELLRARLRDRKLK